MIGHTLSHYKITAKLGEGGMGEVFLAEDTKLDRKVALKFLPVALQNDQQARDRLLREARAASRLTHQNIMTIYGVESANGRDFIVMEFVDGRSLREIIGIDCDLTSEEKYKLMIQVCDGVAAAHESNVVHRDIKPANIMVTPKQQVRIADFGLATWHGATTLTKEGTTIGTAAYMSPEQAQGLHVDYRSDLFSLGVLLCELLTGNRPFDSDHEAAVIYGIINEEPRIASDKDADYGTAVHDVIIKALQKSPDDRYQSAADMVEDLRTILLKGPSARLPHAPRIKSPRSKTNRSSMVVYLAAGLAVLGMAIFASFLRSKPNADHGFNAVEASLLVLPFSNVTEPSDTNKTAYMVSSLLITDLSESRYVRVVDRQRLQEILRLLKYKKGQEFDLGAIQALAKRSNVQWVLTGEILQTSPNFVVSSSLIEAATGEIHKSQRVSGPPTESIFGVVDLLSAAVLGDLPLPEEARFEESRSLAEVTTRSPEAYRYYVEGTDFGFHLNTKEARPALLRAVELDTTFAMAYLALALFGNETLDNAGGRDWISKAVAHSTGVTWKELQFILQMDASKKGDHERAINLMEGVIEKYPRERMAYLHRGYELWLMKRYQEAIADFYKILEFDPSYEYAYNLMAYCYQDMGNTEKSLWAVDQYVDLAPTEANPHDTRGDLLASAGMIEDAIRSYQEALAINPDFGSTGYKLGMLRAVSGQYAQADSTGRAMAGSYDPTIRSSGRCILGFIPVLQGNMVEALRIIEQGINADQLEDYRGWRHLLKLYTRAYLLHDLGRDSEAIRQAEDFIPVARHAALEGASFREYYIELLSDAGEKSRADIALQELSRDVLAAGDSGAIASYHFAAGSLALSSGEHHEALDHFETALRLRIGFQMTEFNITHKLGEAYLAAHRPMDAVMLYEGRLLRHDEFLLSDPVRFITMRYLLGRAHENAGQLEEARSQYQSLLSGLSGDDSGSKVIADAKSRLASLGL